MDAYDPDFDLNAPLQGQRKGEGRETEPISRGFETTEAQTLDKPQPFSKFDDGEGENFRFKVERISRWNRLNWSKKKKIEMKDFWNRLFCLFHLFE